MKIVNRLASLLLTLICLLLVGELGARVGLYFKHDYNLAYLISPLISFEGTAGAPVTYLFRSQGTYTVVDPCTHRTIEFFVNEDGGRGAWKVAKPHGTVRIIATGGSSTFGMNNPNWATWPAFLEQELRNRRNVPVEVLNAGSPSRRLEQINDLLPQQAFKYNADMVIFYETYSNAIVHWADANHVDTITGRFHSDTRIGRLLAPLYYRWSMLYTCLFEKFSFMQAKGNPRVVPEIGYFRSQLQRFIRSLLEHHIVPVLVLQVTHVPVDLSIEKLNLEDSEAVQAEILKAAEVAAPADGEAVPTPLQPIRAYQAQVLVEVVRRAGKASGVQVIDPRPAFAQYKGREPLFCDVVHLTDAGNRLLAQSIAEALVIGGREERPASRTESR